MIETITPLILHTVAQAGGPLTMSGLIQRIRLTLSESSVLAHIRDLADGGHLSISESPNTGMPLVTLKTFDLPPVTRTFLDGMAAKRPPLRRAASLRQQSDAISKAMKDAAERGKRRPRLAPNRAAVLSAIEDEPATAAEIAGRVGLSKTGVEEHLSILRKDGLALRYAFAQNVAAPPSPIWVGSQLRKRLDAAPNTPPKSATGAL